MHQDGTVPRTEASVRDHLANERTMLAWVRTALALIGLGFVIDHFAIEGPADHVPGSLLGLLMIVAGGTSAVVGAWRFVRTERQIDKGDFESAVGAHLVLAGAITLAAVATGAYLVFAP